MKFLMTLVAITLSSQITLATSPYHEARPSAEGTASVTLDSDMAFVEVSGKAAELIFNSMKVQSYSFTKRGDTEISDFKDLAPLNCSKTGAKYSCTVAADLVPLQ